jgi:UDP-N-acetyl-D-glucosamine dehydrogenase
MTPGLSRVCPGPASQSLTSPDADLLVMGLGYVGLPLAAEASRSGLIVAGYDVNREVVTTLGRGHSHIPDISDADVAAMLATGFRATDDPATLGYPATVVICVPTPLSADHRPDLAAVFAATSTAATVLRPGALAVLESTTYPGTTDELVRPILEAGSGLRVGEDFALAFSPERIDPGNPDFGIRNTPKVVGGVTCACTEAAATFYSKVCNEVVRARSAREAEMAKLLENTYRHVNIALVNEMAIFCHELGVDLWNAIACAATKPFGFQPFYPGPGVGGHCIPIDPSYLSYKVRTLGYPFRFVELAQEINARMPAYVVTRAAALLNGAGKPLKGSTILLLGVTYKKDSADLRETPGAPVAQMLMQAGARVTYCDPHVKAWTLGTRAVESGGADVLAAVTAADLVILLQAHSVFCDLDIAGSAQLLLDTRGITSGERL